MYTARLKILFLFVALLLVAAVAGVGGSLGPALAAPEAQITPVAATNPTTGETSTLVKFFEAQAVTADTQECRDLREYRNIDLEYVIDQTTGNTTTITLEHTNGAGASLAVNTTGQTVVAANSADADGLNRFDLYGVYVCVDLNVTNSNPVTFTIYGLARK